jgi:hypothetical protein
VVRKDDYAKWMLDDPRINFAISKRGMKPGLDHLGVQVESSDELTALRDQVRQAEVAALDQENAACCYARSDKYWVTDPTGSVAFVSALSLCAGASSPPLSPSLTPPESTAPS